MDSLVKQLSSLHELIQSNHIESLRIFTYKKFPQNSSRHGEIAEFSGVLTTAWKEATCFVMTVNDGPRRDGLGLKFRSASHRDSIKFRKPEFKRFRYIYVNFSFATYLIKSTRGRQVYMRVVFESII